MSATIAITPMLPGPIILEGGKMVGRGPATPAPYLLTTDEVVRFLRIDEEVLDAVDQASAAYQRLKRLRTRNLLRATRPGECGRAVKYPLSEVLKLVESITEGSRK